MQEADARQATDAPQPPGGAAPLHALVPATASYELKWRIESARVETGLTSYRYNDAAQYPWRHGFMPLMRHIAATHPAQPMVGRAQRPQQEPFRLGQQASMIFAPREIAEVSSRGGLPVIKLFGLGMLGPNGPLPIHMTETVRERTEGKRDATLANFLDIFHHRYLTHLYRAWAQAQSAAGLDRSAEESFSPYVARIAGDEPQDTSGQPLPQHARWASSAHRVREARNPDGLVKTLANYYGVGVALHEYQLHWIAIEPVDICNVGVPRMSSLLGQGAVLGSMVPDRQHKFRLTLGPLDLRQYLRFTPQGDQEGTDLHSLVEWVRAFIGYEYVWEVELVIRRDEAPPARMGGQERLGWSSWMGAALTGETVQGMVYEPENYLQEQAAQREVS